MLDLKNTLDIVQSLPPAARTAAANGTGVDTVNYNGATVVFEVGTVTDGTHVPKVQESDDNATWTDAAAGSLNGTLANLASNSVQKIGYLGIKRYVRGVITATGTTTGAVASCSVIGGCVRKAPV